MLVSIVIVPIALPVSLTSFESLFMIERSAVPACEDLMPELPIKPIASAVSSAENPKAPATGAQYLKVSGQPHEKNKEYVIIDQKELVNDEKVF